MYIQRNQRSFTNETEKLAKNCRVGRYLHGTKGPSHPENQNNTQICGLIIPKQATGT